MINRAYLPPVYALALFLAVYAGPGYAALNKINGMASYELFNQEQFIAALYLEVPEKDPKRLLNRDYLAQMEIRVTAERISRRKLVNLWVEGIAINNDSGKLVSEAESLARFSHLFKKSLHKNDRLALTHRPEVGVEVSLNDVKLAVIPSSELFRMLLSTWIGEVPLSSDFRESILGKSRLDRSLLERFTALQPSTQRRVEVTSWLAPPKTEPAQTEAEASIALALQTEARSTPETAPAPEPALESAALAAKKSSEAIKPRPASSPSLAAKDPEPTRAAPQPVQVSLVQSIDDEKELADDEEELEPDSLDIESSKEDLLRRQEYYSQLVKHTHKFKTIPMLAFQRRLEGDVRLAIEIDRFGKVLSKTIIKGSRHGLFNEQALSAIDRADPYPKIPEKIPDATYSFTVPMIYKLVR